MKRFLLKEFSFDAGKAPEVLRRHPFIVLIYSLVIFIAAVLTLAGSIAGQYNRFWILGGIFFLAYSISGIRLYLELYKEKL